MHRSLVPRTQGKLSDLKGQLLAAIRAAPDSIPLGPPSMDQNADWLIVDLAKVWIKATDRRAGRITEATKNDENYEDQSVEDYDAHVDTSTERFPFADWVTEIVTRAGLKPPAQRHIRRVAMWVGK